MQTSTTPLCEQIGRQKVEAVVTAFYDKMKSHPRLGHFFSQIKDFDEHQQRLSEFWWQALGGKLENAPKFDMIGKHFPLGIDSEDLETWLVIFGETLGEQLEDALARQWMSKALQIGARLKQIVIQHNSPGVTIGEKP